MADHDHPERVWDEHDWERFLQQQDRKTERYMELLEKYIDDPNRDSIIAREMGWFHLLDEDGREWVESVDALFADGGEETDLEAEEFQAEIEGFEHHPLYEACFALTIWIDHFLEELGDAQNHPAGVRLTTQSAIAGAKLAAALSDDDVDEIAMTIAYLKRALKAITIALEAAAVLKREIEIDPEKFAILVHRLFQIRDGIISLMGDYRADWRRRFGAG
ncbi:MAG: hypothetical protein M3O82_08765 [Verrucomicrobiota bacterium]|nr:hypothetical protein [Verrucomicrobiota bacterium]